VHSGQASKFISRIKGKKSLKKEVVSSTEELCFEESDCHNGKEQKKSSLKSSQLIEGGPK